MAQLCRACHHPDKDSIDSAVIAGESVRSVAERYGLSRDGLGRHIRNHLSPALARLRTQQQEERQASLLDRIESLILRAERLYNVAEGAGQATQALNVLRELRGLLELLGRASGELRDSPQVVVNLQASPEWQQLRAVVLTALLAYPEARQAVAGRLLELEAGAS